MELITDITLLDTSRRYTYADYLRWRLDEYVELIKGVVYRMSPAPARRHQQVNTEFVYQLVKFLKDTNSTCQVYGAPFDVRLLKNRGKNMEIDTVVQPDICVVCDLSKLDDAGCLGSPDLIVEILSPSTAKKDYNEKFNLYEENEVLEYWIVNPEARSVEIYSLKEGKLLLDNLYSMAEADHVVSSCLFPDLKIELGEVFSD